MTATTPSGCRLALETKFDPRVTQWLAFAVPTIAELSIRKRALMRLAQRHLTPDRLWVNPDCGLKTRKWAGVRLAIATMVSAARTLRADPSARI